MYNTSLNRYGGGGYDDYRYGGKFPGEEASGPLPGYLWISNLQYFVDGFARFSQLLDANCDAIYGSFTSIIRLLESFGHLRREILYAFQALTIFGVLKKIVVWIAGQPRKNLDPSNALSKRTGNSPDGNIDVSSFMEFQNRRAFWPLRLFVFLVLLVGGPLMLIQLIKLLLRFTGFGRKSTNLETLWNEQGREALDGEMGDQKKDTWTVLYDFRARNEEELTIIKGEEVTIVSRPFDEWWEAEKSGQRGLIPANYVILPTNNTTNKAPDRKSVV